MASAILKAGDLVNIDVSGIFTAQFEHTRVITKGKPLIMTLPA